MGRMVGRVAWRGVLAMVPVLVGGGIAAGEAAAQVAPPAAVLQRNPAINPDRINDEQRRRLEERTDRALATSLDPTVEAPPPPAEAAASGAEVRFTLTALAIGPSAYIPQETLDAIARPLIGREVAIADLQGVVDAINRLYAERGLTTARAILPVQQIDGGRVTIRLVEGRIGATSVEGGSARSRRYAERRGAPPVGSLAAPAAIEQRLRLFNRNNDAQLSARLAPGTTTGTTDIALVVAEPPLLSADVFLDNNGFASTGVVEVGAVVRGYRLFGDADRATLAVVASRGVRSGSATVSAPLADRLRVGASLSYGKTRVLFGPIAALGVTGTSLAFGADAAALLVSDESATLTATAGLQTSLSRTRIAGRAVIANDATTASLGLVGSYVVAGFSASIQHQVAYAHVVETISGVTTSPVLFQGSAQVAKALGQKVTARVRGDWQLATKRNLPGVIQYQIGGARSSRAYDPGVAAGDEGLALSGELAYAASLDDLAIEPFALVDYARVVFPGQVATATSVGAGLNLTLPRGIAVRATLATAMTYSGPVGGDTRAFVSTTFRF